MSTDSDPLQYSDEPPGTRLVCVRYGDWVSVKWDLAKTRRLPWMLHRMLGGPTRVSLNINSERIIVDIEDEPLFADRWIEEERSPVHC